jgi:hypothetical protein
MHGILSFAPISNCGVLKMLQNRIRPSKSVGLVGLQSFVIKDFSEISVHVTKFSFNFKLSQNKFPNLCKQVAIVPVFEKGKISSAGNYGPIAILSNFFQNFEICCT